MLNNTETPKLPDMDINTNIYELFNEDLRPGGTSDKNRGIFSANSMQVYVLHLNGVGLNLYSETLAQAFYVALLRANTELLQAVLDRACGPV